MKKSKGQVLAIVVLLLMMFSILVPLMVYYAQRESTWTAKQAKSTTAFHLAEAGSEKAFYILSQSTANWAQIQAAKPISGFNFDKSYNDLAGGSYAILISSGPSTQEATVISVGRDSIHRETRAIQTIYSESAVNAPMVASGITTGGGATVEWGPMVSYNTITVSGNGNTSYPQMYAVGAISGSGGSRGTWSATQVPCTDNLSWWAYNCPPGVPTAPGIYLNSYKAQAIAQGLYYNASNPPPPVFNNTIDTTTYVRYFDNVSAKFGAGTFLQGSIIMTGSGTTLNFAGNGNGNYTTGIPPKAAQQYQLIDTSASSDFYGDAGGGPPSSLNSTFQFGMGGNPAKQIGLKDSVTMHGFLYVEGTISTAGSTVIHGVVYAPNGLSGAGGNVTIFFDTATAAGISFSSFTPSRVSWKEAMQQWPNGI